MFSEIVPSADSRDINNVLEEVHTVSDMEHK